MKLRKKIVVIAGTRPEVIKLAPVCYALERSALFEPVLVSSGQHRQMLDQTLNVFGLKPSLDFGLMSPGQGLPELTAGVITQVSRMLREVRPSAVLVQGDTTTVLGAAIGAFYERVPIGHVEAGLRTGDMGSPFPEEMNRRLTSPLARWNFCPTEVSRENLLRESIAPQSCYVTGNTVIDALLWVRERMRQDPPRVSRVAERLGICADFAGRFLAKGDARWILVTGHRRESFDGGIERICRSIMMLLESYPDIGILYPVHLNPKVQEPVRRMLGGHPRVALAQPAGYEDFIWLLDRCYFALSDSGGVQEEAPSLGKPVLVMRETTERPEGVNAGTCRLVGTDPSRIKAEADLLLCGDLEYKRRASLRNPYGEGIAAEKIVQILESTLD